MEQIKVYSNGFTTGMVHSIDGIPMAHLAYSCQPCGAHYKLYGHNGQMFQELDPRLSINNEQTGQLVCQKYRDQRVEELRKNIEAANRTVEIYRN
ncbi:MAG: hypothetical protein ACQESG_00350 [Nanobdellota archaeon]